MLFSKAKAPQQVLFNKWCALLCAYRTDNYKQLKLLLKQNTPRSLKQIIFMINFKFRGVLTCAFSDQTWTIIRESRTISVLTRRINFEIFSKLPSLSHEFRVHDATPAQVIEMTSTSVAIRPTSCQPDRSS